MPDVNGLARDGASILKQTFREFIDDDCPRMAAALAYYAIFSLPPLLVIVVTLTGLFLSPEVVETWIHTQVGGIVGESSARQIQTMVENARQRVQGGFSVGLILSILGLIVGATAAFAQMQKALNTAWDVERDTEQGGIMTLVMKRVLSLGMIIAVAFLLLISLILSSLISGFAGQLGAALPGDVSVTLIRVLDVSLSLVVITFLFAAIFRYLPDARISWRNVWVGALATTVLFILGKYVISLYIGQSNPAEAYGAAAALALLLIWVYYSSMIFFLGAEFTQIWTRRRSGGILPAKGAVKLGGTHARRETRDRPGPRGPQKAPESHEPHA